jgi:hypothetical protein
MEKTSTFTNEMIHTTPNCVVHLHGHRNKVVPFFYLWILTMALSFAAAPTSQLMTLKAIVSCIELITSTSTTKT